MISIKLPKIVKRGCTQKKTYQTFLHLYLCFVLVELHSKIHHLSVYPFVVFFKMKILSFHSWESWKKIDSRLCKSLLHRNFGCRYCQLSSLIISDWSTAVAELGACLNVSVILGTYVYRLKKHKVNPIHDIYRNKQIKWLKDNFFLTLFER